MPGRRMRRPNQYDSCFDALSLFLSSLFRKQPLSLTISVASFLGSLRRSFCCFLQRFVSSTANLNGVLWDSARGLCFGLRSFGIRCRGFN